LVLVDPSVGMVSLHKLIPLGVKVEQGVIQHHQELEVVVLLPIPQFLLHLKVGLEMFALHHGSI
jgi:hypothetical protein